MATQLLPLPEPPSPSLIVFVTRRACSTLHTDERHLSKWSQASSLLLRGIVATEGKSLTKSNFSIQTKK